MLVFANSGVIYRSVSAETYTLKVMGTRISLIYRMAWVINRLNGLNVLRALKKNNRLILLGKQSTD